MTYLLEITTIACTLTTTSTITESDLGTTVKKTDFVAGNNYP